MNTKPFLLLLIAALVLGGSAGGVVVAVSALGGNAEESSILTLPDQSTPSDGQASQTASDESDQERLRQLEASGQDTGGQPDTNSGDQSGQSFRGAGFGGGGRLIGTIEKVEGNMITVTTPQGTQAASYGDDTVIQMLAQGTLADLEIGMQARVVGQRGTDGTLQVQSAVITPEGASGFPDGGSRGGGFPGGGQFGELSQEELAELRQQFQGQFGQGTGDRGEFGQRPGGQGEFGQRSGGPGGFGQGQFGQGQFGQRAAGGVLTGTIEQIEGNIITINTSRGPLQATIGDDTAIQIFTVGTLTGLETGLGVTVTGQRGEDGTVIARTIVIAPEGIEGLFEGQGFRGGRGSAPGQ